MVYTKKSFARATESVTFRLTMDEKRLLEHMANVENMSNVDLLRSLLLWRARDLNITELPPPAPKKGPGRPPKRPPWTPVTPVPATSNSTSIEIVLDQTGSQVNRFAEVESAAMTTAQVSEDTVSKVQLTDQPGPPGTAGELAILFRGHFSTRAEGTRREMEETLQFLLYEGNFPGLLGPGTSLSSVDEAFLGAIREALRVADIKFSRKNLHLTYFRMMLQWAIKQNYLPAQIDPARHLPGFTAREISDAWPSVSPLIASSEDEL